MSTKNGREGVSQICGEEREDFLRDRMGGRRREGGWSEIGGNFRPRDLVGVGLNGFGEILSDM